MERRTEHDSSDMVAKILLMGEEQLDPDVIFEETPLDLYKQLKSKQRGSIAVKS